MTLLEGQNKEFVLNAGAQLQIPTASGERCKEQCQVVRVAREVNDFAA